MSKKNFKSNISGADKLFSANDVLEQQEISGVWDTQEVKAPPDETIKIETQAKKKMSYYRFNLKINVELKDYIQEAAWRSRMTITEYINQLIIMDQAQQAKEE